MDTLAKDAERVANIHHMEKIVKTYVNVPNLFAILQPDVALSIVGISIFLINKFNQKKKKKFVFLKFVRISKIHKL